MGERGTLTISTRLDGPCVRVDIADDGPGIPPEARPHVLDRSSRPSRSARGRAWAWTPRARSSRSTTPGRSASTPAPAARPSTCGCRSRARCADLPPSGHGDLHPSGHDHGDRAARGGGRLRGLPARRRQVAAPAHLPGPAATSAAATTRPTGTRPSTRARPSTRSSARWSPARTGSGASPTRWRCIVEGSTARRGSRRHRCSSASAGAATRPATARRAPRAPAPPRPPRR